MRNVKINEYDEVVILTKKEVAKLFSVHANTITNWSNSGILKAYTLGQRVYYKKTECLDVLFTNSKSA